VEECGCHGLRDPNIILGILIWALLLTVIVIVVLILATRTPEDFYVDRWYYAGSLKSQ
jgi:hypothetical protein